MTDRNPYTQTTTCSNCGETLPPINEIKHMFGLKCPQDPHGKMEVAITFTLNKTKGCAHAVEVYYLYQELMATYEAFNAAVAQTKKH